jgi:hypothetical protein
MVAPEDSIKAEDYLYMILVHTAVNELAKGTSPCTIKD